MTTITAGQSQDVRLALDEVSGLYDLVIDADVADIASIQGMETAIETSLFTDSRAPESLVPSPEYRRGWVANTLTAQAQRELGGIVWVFDQSRITQDTLNQLQLAALASFDWMISDGVARNITVSVDQVRGAVYITLIYEEPTGDVKRYKALWRKTGEI